MSRLRSVSKKRRASGLFTKSDPVYQHVDQRSGLRCEVVLPAGPYGGPDPRCHRKQRDHHHTRGRAVHTIQAVMGICRFHHEQVDRPKASGQRLVTKPNGDETFTCYYARAV